jgi:hypothetical protein
MSVPSTRGPQKIPTSQIIHEWVEVVPDFRAPRRELKLFAESLGQKGGVDLHLAVLVRTPAVLDEAKLSELIHKEVHARASRRSLLCETWSIKSSSSRILRESR